MAIAADPAPEPVLANSFDPVIYTGDNTARTISTGFAPDLVWIKNRNNSTNSTHDHSLFDSVRTTGYRVRSNSIGEENDYSSHMSGFTSGGFNLTTSGALNDSAGTYVAWCWKAAGIPAINQNGTIDSIVSANPAAGFSIVSYTGTNNVSETFGHGLSSAPELIIIKNRDVVANMFVYPKSLGNFLLRLNTTGVQDTTSNYQLGTVNDSIITLPSLSSDSWSQPYDFIAYCFHSVAGHSKIGSYPGTGLAGNFVSTSVGGDAGFQPRFVMIKSSSNAEPWFILDAARDTSNPRDNRLMADSSAAEDDGSVHTVDFTSTGFTANSTVGNGTNGVGVTYIYLCYC